MASPTDERGGDDGHLILPWVRRESTALATRSGLSRRDVCERIGAVEEQVRSSPAAHFTLDGDGTATLRANGTSYHAGRFETPTIAALEQRVRQIGRARPGSIRLSILRGTGLHTDIGTLQATAPAGTLFQVASQFNCLEAPGAQLVPIQEYPFDPTQGPRASVSAFPGTMLRHYHAPRASGERFVQTDDDCINLLADAIPPEAATVNSGYLTSASIGDPVDLARALEARFEQIRVGVHDDTEVVLGTDWGGSVPNAPHQRIAQVFTSTVALGVYSDDDSAAIASVCQQLLRAAYYGTLLASVALRKHTAVLTLIGGGVFGNPHRVIWDAIHWAVAKTDPFVSGTLDVVVNARDAAVPDEKSRSCFNVSYVDRAPG